MNQKDSRSPVVLITGAARRIGRAIALSLADEGCDIIIHYKTSKAKAEELAEEIETHNQKSWTIKADLENESEITQMCLQAIDITGGIDILINSAAIFPGSRITDFDISQLEKNIRINAFAPLVLSRIFAGQNKIGTIINFLDARIVDYDSEHAAYHLSKRMLYSMTRMLALEYAPDIRVNAIAPGLILPPAGKDRSYIQRLVASNPLCSVGEVEDIIEAVKFLISAKYITGQVLFIDGGRHLKGSVY